MLTDPRPELEIRHELEEWLLKSAGVAAPMKSRCDVPAGFSRSGSGRFPCTVTYGKLAVTYQVDAKPSSSRTFSWDATAEQTVVTRTGLLTAVANRYRTDGGRFSDVRCAELPEVALVPTGKALPQQCYVRIAGQDKTASIDLIPTRNELRLDTRLQ